LKGAFSKKFMIVFLKEYLEKLRKSEEKVIHKHSLRWAIGLSLLILIFVFTIWGEKIFDFSSFKNLSKQNVFKEIGEDLSQTKIDFENLKDNLKNIASSSLP